MTTAEIVYWTVAAAGYVAAGAALIACAVPRRTGRRTEPALTHQLAGSDADAARAARGEAERKLAEASVVEAGGVWA